MALMIPTDRDRERAEAWMREHRSADSNYQSLAKDCAENLGFWEEDIGFDGELRDFPPVWLLKLSEDIFNEKEKEETKGT